MDTLSRILFILQSNNIEQKELCDFLQISNSVFSDWKSGRNKSYKKRIYEIAQFLNVSADYLLGNTDIPASNEGTMFFKNLIQLCSDNKTTPNAVCIALGLSPAAATKWRSGAVPRETTLLKIASYFNVTVDYLLGKDTPASSEENDEKRELLNRIAQMDDDQLKQLSDYADYIIDKKKN